MLMFTREGPFGNRRLAGDKQQARRRTWREYTVFSGLIQITIIRGKLIQNSRSTYTDFATISNFANVIFFAS